jgi:hypothetical protein
VTETLYYSKDQIRKVLKEAGLTDHFVQNKVMPKFADRVPTLIEEAPVADYCVPLRHSITEQELTASIKRVTRIYAPEHPRIGEMILQDIRDHREPEWHYRDVVQDSKGRMYRRNSIGGWSSFSSTYVKDDGPARPLRLIGKDGE